MPDGSDRAPIANRARRADAREPPAGAQQHEPDQSDDDPSARPPHSAPSIRRQGPGGNRELWGPNVANRRAPAALATQTPAAGPDVARVPPPRHRATLTPDSQQPR